MNTALDLAIALMLGLMVLIAGDAYAYQQTNKYGNPVEIRAHVLTFEQIDRFCTERLPRVTRGGIVLGCAFFNKALTRCSIYYSSSMPWVKSHEEQHCRDGHFHP